MIDRKVGTYLRAGCAVATTLAAVLFAAPAPAQQCISPQAQQRLAECPGGKFQASVTKKPQVSFNTAPTGFEKKQRVDSLKPENPTEITKSAVRDERRARLEPQRVQLLYQEISNVEMLYKDTAKKSAERPVLMRRLAENYVELESAAFREKIENQVKAQELNRSDPKKAAAAKQRAERADKIIRTARDAAIKHYTRLKEQYPTWCEQPNKAEPEKSKGCIDEVLYYLAYEYEQAGNFDKARDAYIELTKNWTKSRFLANAYLAFGELFFQQAQGDPGKWKLAEGMYAKVLTYPLPENKLQIYARYKLAYVYWNQEKLEDAIREFKKVVEDGMAFASLPNSQGLTKSARRDIIPVYALKGDPNKAYADFRPISGDTGASSTGTFSMMEDLGQNYLDTGHYDEAIALYQDLMRRNRGDNYCFYQAQITQAVLASKSGTKDPIMVELKKQLATYEDFKKAKHSDKSQLVCANSTASLLAETAMAWHLEAVGSGGVRGTNDPKTMSKADELYALVINGFTSEQFSKFTFPRIMKEDWPTIPKVKYAMADLLFYQKKWDKCGPAFDAVVAEDPNGPNAAEAAFAAVLCYQKMYLAAAGDKAKDVGRFTPDSERGGDGSEAAKLAPKPFTDSQKGMLTAFNRYVCYIKPPEGDKDALEEFVDVKYARARTYFEAQHWEEAAGAFRDIAINHANLDAAVFAAQLYLESLNVLGSRLEPKKTDCYNDMATDVPTFIESFCNEKRLKDNEDQCQVLFRIQRDIKRLQAQELIAEADKNPGAPESIAKYEQGAQLYLDLWRQYGEQACLDKKPACEKSEEILYNAARAFQAARLVAKAISVRQILIDARFGLHETEPAKLAVYEIGGNWQAIAVYDAAAKWYERFANENPKHEKAPAALSDAVVLRLGLGQHAEAIQNSQDFNQRYGTNPKHRAQAGQIAFAIGAHYAERQDWNNAERTLARMIGQIDANATPDVKIQAHALLGRIYAATGKRAQADREYGTVKASWDNQAKIDALTKALDDLGGSQAEKDRRFGKVLTAVGEALYYEGEKLRQQVEAIEFPAYKGSGEKADVDKFIGTKVKEWMEKKKPLIIRASETYGQVLTLKPAPPPVWVIKAGSAVGDLWGRFVAEFRAAPYPKDWDRSGESPYGADPANGVPPLLWAEIRASYLAGLDAASEPFKENAKQAYKKCLDYSVTYQYFDEDSRTCEEWLSKKYPNEFHLIDEFRGAPTRVNSGLDERPQPLNLDGTPALIDLRHQASTEAGGAQKGGSQAK